MTPLGAHPEHLVTVNGHVVAVVPPCTRLHVDPDAEAHGLVSVLARDEISASAFAFELLHGGLQLGNLVSGRRKHSESTEADEHAHRNANGSDPRETELRSRMHLSQAGDRRFRLVSHISQPVL